MILYFLSNVFIYFAKSRKERLMQQHNLVYPVFKSKANETFVNYANRKIRKINESTNEIKRLFQSRLLF